MSERSGSAWKRGVTGVLHHPGFPAACFTAALVVRLLWIAAVEPEPGGDFRWYFEQGVRIAAGQGYTVTHDGSPMWERGPELPAPRPTAFWPMGYPYFLGGVLRLTAGWLEPLLAAQLANVALSLAAMAAMGWSAAALSGAPLAGRITLLLLAFLPNHIAYVTLTSAEIPFAALTAVGVALLLRSRRAHGWGALAAAGVVLGLAVYVKPQGVLVPAAVLLALHGRDWRGLLRAAAVTYALVALVLVPMAVRNHRAFGTFVFVSTNDGFNLAIGNLPGAYAPGVFWTPELTAIVRSPGDEIERNRRAKALAIDYVTRHPGPVLASLPGKLVRLYAADVDGFGWNRSSDEKLRGSPVWVPLRVVSQLYYLALVVLAALALSHARDFGRGAFRVGPALFLCLTAVYLVFFGGPRFHFPLVPWFAAYASVTLARWLGGVPLIGAAPRSSA